MRVVNATFTDVGASLLSTYGGVFALAGKDVQFYGQSITTTYGFDRGFAGIYGGVFAVMNAATVTVVDSSFQSSVSVVWEDACGARRVTLTLLLPPSRRTTEASSTWHPWLCRGPWMSKTPMNGLAPR